MGRETDSRSKMRCLSIAQGASWEKPTHSSFSMECVAVCVDTTTPQEVLVISLMPGKGLLSFKPKLV